MLQNIKKGYNFTKSNYDLAKKNNDLERFRGDEISYRISQVVPLSDQIGIAIDATKKPEKLEAYQAFREQIIQWVDADIEEMENTARS
jgi:hypothetical protein